MKKIFLLLGTTLIFACATTKETATISNSDLERGKAKYPDMTMESLKAGKMNFEQQCTKCHGLKNPKSKTSEQWHEIVPVMSAKANKKAGSEVVDAAMQESILRYLVTMSKS